MAQNDLIIFGDGLQALFYEERHIQLNLQGEKVQPILVVPSEELKEIYALTDADLPIRTSDGKSACWRDFPPDFIYPLRRSKTGSTTFIYCAFDGSDTRFMEHNGELLEACKQRDINISRLKMSISKLQKELLNVTSQQALLMQKQRLLSDIVSAGQQQDQYGDEQNV